MSLPECATASAVSSKKRRIAFDSGYRAVELVKENLCPLDIVTKESLRNAIICDYALGGSTNSFLHLLAVAAAGDIELKLDDFEELTSKIKQIVKLDPTALPNMVDFHNAGGICGLLRVLSENIPEFNNTVGVTGKKIKDIVKDIWYNPELIHSPDNPITTQPGLGVLYGNIAPEGSVIKISGVDESCYYFEGTAKVFDSEEESMAALENDIQTCEMGDRQVMGNINTLGEGVVESATITPSSDGSYYTIVMTLDLDALNADPRSIEFLEDDNSASNMKWNKCNVTFEMWKTGLFKSYSIEENWSGHIVIYDGAAEVSNKVFYSYTKEDCSMDKEIAFLKEFDAAL